jgi:hypothetical protein
MMAWEIDRHRRLGQLAPIGNGMEPWQVEDVRDYLYVQTSKWAGNPALQNQTCIDICVQLKNSETVFSSTFGDWRAGEFRAAYTGPYEWFSTTVKLPKGTAMEDIEAIEARLLDGGDLEVTVRGLKAFMLNENYLPLPALETDGEMKLTLDQPVGKLWPSV